MTTATPQTAAKQDFAAYRTQPGDETRGYSIASLVLGVVSIAAGFTFFVPLAGLITGILGLKREPAGRTMAIWGIVLSAVMLAGFVLFGIIMIGFGLAALPFAFIF